ncbi:MAG: hypothetical protein COX63_03150 [Candidatus Diapherotrites archaeon CG_4_10_14_0_2_um_filter_31_5]|nr:MAG: hypothetical protein COX63_03150 [Candidatus Diapherotrites archaeon CG_4_10_14_0_2_um_filter_31_5]
MLGFTLSKINLLIFVVAVFSIVLFFVFSFSQILVENIANDYVRIHAQDAFTLVGSPTLCAAQIHYLKDSIEASSGNSGRGLYYVLNIKQGTGKNGLNKMIFALAPRRTPETYMAAASFDTDAKMNFFDFQELITANPSKINIYDSNTMLDPQAKTQIDAYVLLKEVNLGETTIYVIPCSSRGGSDCSTLMGIAGQKIRPERFNCSYEN